MMNRRDFIIRATAAIATIGLPLKALAASVPRLPVEPTEPFVPVRFQVWDDCGFILSSGNHVERLAWGEYRITDFSSDNTGTAEPQAHVFDGAGNEIVVPIPWHSRAFCTGSSVVINLQFSLLPTRG